MTVNTPSQRRYDLDWLRVILIGLVFIFHSGRFFDTGGWHVKNAETYFGVQVWTTFLANWMMPAIFMVSGASLFFALSGSNGKFIKDKVLRLLVPLVVGAFTHVAVQVYLERITHHQFVGTFFEFLPQYFNGLYGLGGNFAWMGLHLWYLLVLFIFSITLEPTFRWMKGDGANTMRRFGDVLSRPLVVYALAIPIAFLMVNLDPRTLLGSRDMGGWPLTDLHAILHLWLHHYLACGLAGAHQAAALVVAGIGHCRHRGAVRAVGRAGRCARRHAALRPDLHHLRDQQLVLGVGDLRLRHEAPDVQQAVLAVAQRSGAALLRAAPIDLDLRRLLRRAVEYPGCGQVARHRGDVVRHHHRIDCRHPAGQRAALPVRHEAPAPIEPKQAPAVLPVAQ